MRATYAYPSMCEFDLKSGKTGECDFGRDEGRLLNLRGGFDAEA